MNKLHFHFGLLLLGFGGVLSAAAERIPVEDFARTANITDAHLSPDGECMGYIFNHGGRSEISFLDLKTGKAAYFSAGSSQGNRLQVYDFQWVTNRRVAVATSIWETWFAGLASLDRSASDWVGLTGLARWDSIHAAGYLNARSIIHADPRNGRLLLLDEGDGFGDQTLFPSVVEMDARTGAFRQVVQNPGNVLSWLADWDGNVRIGLQWDGRTTEPQLIHRDARAAGWQSTDLGQAGTRANILGMNPSGDEIYLTKADPGGRWALYRFDFKNRRLSGPLFQHDHYDIVPGEYGSSFAGVELAAAIFSEKSHDLLGVRYLTEVPKQYWFNPGFADLQRTIDALLPNLVNTIVSTDRQERRFLVLSWSDREPGVYTLIDLANHQSRVIGQRMPWIKAAQMAPMYPIECTAPDGVALHGYLTPPPGIAPKNLPTVMMVHGGPWVRDIWGFDPLVQFLASRGYAVLQINYRGSVGYGTDFCDKGLHEIGGAIEGDVAAAARWAVKGGIADPRRMAIMGGSYGGYSTLFLLAKAPGLFRCGIDLAGVTDWPAILKESDRDDYKYARVYWKERIGDVADKEVLHRLETVSPVNFAAEISAPLLIVHGKEDRTVPFDQATRLVSALRRAGHKPETLYFGDLAHSYPHDKEGVVFLKKLEAFLATSLAP